MRAAPALSSLLPVLTTTRAKQFRIATAAVHPPLLSALLRYTDADGPQDSGSVLLAAEGRGPRNSCHVSACVAHAVLVYLFGFEQNGVEESF